MQLVLYIVFGVLAGIFGGMGMGGGTVLIPLLTIFLGVGQKLAQGYNLISFILMAIVAIIIYIKNKLIDLKSIIWIVVFGLAFCAFGAFWATKIDTTVLKYVFGVFLILIAIYEIIESFRKQ